MTPVVFSDQGFIVIGVAIAAEMGASVVGTNIGTKKTGTAFPRRFAAGYRQLLAESFFKDGLRQAAVRVDIVPLQNG